MIRVNGYVTDTYGNEKLVGSNRQLNDALAIYAPGVSYWDAKHELETAGRFWVSSDILFISQER